MIAGASPGVVGGGGTAGDRRRGEPRLGALARRRRRGGESPPDGGPPRDRHRGRASAISLYATGRAGAVLPASWVVLSARLIGAVALALPLALAGRLRLTSRAAPLVVASGVAEVAGFYSYTLGSRHGLAIAAVLSSQFAVLALAASYVLFSERLSRVQLTGVAGVAVGVAVLSALSA